MDSHSTPDQHSSWQSEIASVEHDANRAFLDRDLARLDELFSDDLVVNSPINLINDKKGPEAVELLTKLIAQFPTTNELYYYRGRAYVASDKLDDARADFEKFVSLAPTTKEAADAKKILEQIKK